MLICLVFGDQIRFYLLWLIFVMFYLLDQELKLVFLWVFLFFF